MTHDYDAAVAQLDKLKKDYAAHKEQQRIRRKPLMTAFAGICALVISSLLFSSGLVGAGLLLTGLAIAAFVMAYRLRSAQP